jgi:hypothetical protein
MFDEIEFEIEFFEGLERVDAAIVASVAVGGCARCGGRLDRGDYARKPRGGLFAVAGEASVRRYSLCCSREGCRKRATPPSVRFLGRRVYLGAAVVVASVFAMRFKAARAIRRAAGIPARTTRRWLSWWRGAFTATGVFVALSSRLVPAVSKDDLPLSVLQRISGCPIDRVRCLLERLSPLTTSSVLDGSRFSRAAAAARMIVGDPQKMA